MKNLINVVYGVQEKLDDVKKGYTHYAYDNYKRGDIVTVETKHGYQLATVLGEATVLPDGYTPEEIKEIIDVVDFSGFTKRREIQKKKDMLRAEMQKRIREAEEMALFKQLAESDDAMKELFEQYSKLAG